MKRILCLLAGALTALCWICPEVHAQQELIPVGQVVALSLEDDTVTVAGVESSATPLQLGDQLLSIDDQTIRTPQDVLDYMQSAGDTVKIRILRNGKEQNLSVTPEKTASGKRLGIYLRRGVAGMGTITYCHPGTGEFATLGHGVSDCRGQLLEMEQGSVYPATVQSVKRGKSGAPGQLKGSVRSEKAIGALRKNTGCGVFGELKTAASGQALPVADFEEVHLGNAKILSTVNEKGPREYSVEIVKIYAENRQNHRNFLIRVTDPDLLEQTGGIVQGMSGSPIIQDGKLIGAVTHVLVNDPTTGYGIFIENMLDAAA